MRKKYILITVLILLKSAAVAQSARELMSHADKLFRRKEYFAAAELYERCFFYRKSSDRVYTEPSAIRKIVRSNGIPYAMIAYKLAESYRLSYHYKAARAWYEKAIALQVERADARYWYGVSLRANGQIDTAESVFNIYLRGLSPEDKYYYAAQQELENIAFIRQQFLKNDNNALMVNAVPLQTPSMTSASAMVSIDSGVVFAATIQEGRNYLNRLYAADLKDDQLIHAEKLPLPAVADAHETAPAFTPDGKYLFFTSWRNTPGNSVKAIYKCERLATGWSLPVILDSMVNYPRSNALHPFVTTDGSRLLFASDRPGGHGGYDLWVALLGERATPGKPQNLGQIINGPGDEMAPFYHASSGQLVFASNGRTGMGGQDLFSSKGDFGIWKIPQNMGYPVNSVKDDLFFYCREGGELLQRAYISSDRDADCCLGLFSLSRVPPVVTATDTFVMSKEETLKGEVAVRDTSGSVYFDYDKTVLRPEALAKLDSIAAIMKSDSSLALVIAGHTDGKGSYAYNRKLAYDRARACRQYLVSQGVSGRCIEVRSFGKTRPIAVELTAGGKDNPVARQYNRRAEYSLVINYRRQ